MKRALRLAADAILARHCADPAARKRRSEAMKAAWAARDGLTDEQREIVDLYRRKGFTRAEALSAVADLPLQERR